MTVLHFAESSDVAALGGGEFSFTNGREERLESSGSRDAEVGVLVSRSPSFDISR
jgi:hypothetical protein